MPITATGLGSGLDVESLVSQLVLAEMLPSEQRINASESLYQAKLSALGLVKSEIGAFETALNSAANLGNFSAQTALASGDSFTATADGTAQTGTFQLSVSTLASSQYLATDDAAGFTSTSDVVGSGTLTIQSLKEGSEATVISIDSSNNTLAGIRDAINAADAGATASIIFDGNTYRLTLVSSNSGLENRINVSALETVDDGNPLTGLSVLSYSSSVGTGSMVETVAAKDAVVKVNNVEVSNASNTIEGVIEGVTLTLKATTSDAQLLTISDNISLAKSAIQQFVNGFNELTDTLTGVTAYNVELKTASTLTGDATIRSIENQLRRLINTPIENVGGQYSTLAELGITTDVMTGNLQIDSTKLDAALATNMLDVANVFTKLGRSSDSNLEFKNSTSATQSGQYAVEFSQSSTSGSLLTNAITTTGNNGGEQITFTITVDGESVAVNLDTDTPAEVPAVGSNPTLDEVRQAIESAINNGLTNGRSVSVSIDATPAFTFTSGSSGESSTVSISAESSSSGRFGLVVKDGVDGATTTTASIDGIAATYDAAENTITGAEGTGAEGLMLSILGGASSISTTVNYGIGLASLLNDYVDSVLASDGLLVAKTDGIEKSIAGLETDREALEYRALKLEETYRTQFNGLETLISQLTATQTFLSNALNNFVEPLSFKK
jgi:flagellar hook-associated protein 2